MITHTIDSYQIPSKKKYGKNVSRIVDFFQGESRKIRKICEFFFEILEFCYKLNMGHTL